MFVARQISSVSRVAAIRAPSVCIRSARPIASRFFSQTTLRASTPDTHSKAEVSQSSEPRVSTRISEVERPEDLFGPGAEAGSVPTDFEQATGLERLELLGNLAGIDIFDSQPLSPTRVGTIADPIILDVPVDQKYIACTGVPADSHDIEWMNATIYEPARCLECGSVFRLNYVGPLDEIHEDKERGVYFKTEE